MEFRDVSKAFGTASVLDGFSLSVSAGETVALIGPSGSGKTTALRLVNRLIADPLDSLAGLALVGLGVPAYYAWRYTTRRRQAPTESVLARNVSA